jgi:hypothetical protein
LLTALNGTQYGLTLRRERRFLITLFTPSGHLSGIRIILNLKSVKQGQQELPSAFPGAVICGPIARLARFVVGWQRISRDALPLLSYFGQDSCRGSEIQMLL